MSQSQTKNVMRNTPVVLENGRVLFSQARPKLHYKPPTRRYQLDLLDQLERIQYNLRLIRVSRGGS